MIFDEKFVYAPNEQIKFVNCSVSHFSHSSHRHQPHALEFFWAGRILVTILFEIDLLVNHRCRCRYCHDWNR